MACFLTLPILALCLSLCFVPTKQAKGDEVFGQLKEFGCTFDTIFYKTRNISDPIWQSQPYNGIYINSKFNMSSTISPTQKDIPPHEKPIGEAAKFRPIEHKVLNTKEWDIFKSEVQKSFVEILKTHTLNNVDPFIRFLKAYNDETVRRQREKMEKISIESFLYGYSVPYFEKENPAGLIIELFHEIQSRDDVTVKVGPYLVSAYVDPPQLNVSNVRKGYADLTDTRFQDHVAGVIQIYYENRLGYILLEPGYYNTYLVTPFAVVLMEDGKSPHGEFIFGKNLNGITFTMGHPSNMYVVATYTKATGVKNIVYYLGKAYCSFLESTSKGDLLRSEHGIVSFDEQGLGRGHLSFNIKYPNYFMLGKWMIHEKELYPQISYERMNFRDFYSEKLNKTEKTAVDKFSESLFLRPEQLIRKIQLLIQELLNTPKNMTQYEEFYKTLTALSDKYNLEKVVNAKMVVTNVTNHRTQCMIKRLFIKRTMSYNSKSKA